MNSNSIAEELSAIVQSAYRILCGPRGAQRDWAAMRTLLWPDARIRVIRPGDGGALSVLSLNVEEWFARASARFESMDFHEQGVIEHVLISPHLAFVASPYVSRSQPGGPVTERGINHYTFIFDDKVWRMAQIAWEVLEVPPLEYTETP